MGEDSDFDKQSFAMCKAYFDKKFAELDNHNKERDENLEKNNKERDRNLVKKINEFINGIKKLEKRQDTLAEENENLRFELNRLRNEFNYEVNRDRAPNLIFRNCKTKDDLEETLRNRILKILKEAKVVIDCDDITSARREGRPSPDGSVILPIKVKLSEPALKKLIFPVAKQIRLAQGISIDNDYSRPQRDELYQVRCTRRTLLQNGVNCHTRGFEVWINNRAYNWQAALRYARSRNIASQPQTQMESAPDTPASLKRNSQGLSPLEQQQRRIHKKVNNTVKPKNNPIRSARLSQASASNIDDMNESFDGLFGNE